MDRLAIGQRDSVPDTDPPESPNSLTLTTGGITLLGILLSVSVSVAFGISGPWWLRVIAGVVTLGTLLVVVKLGSRDGRGPLARLARWAIGYPERS